MKFIRSVFVVSVWLLTVLIFTAPVSAADNDLLLKHMQSGSSNSFQLTGDIFKLKNEDLIFSITLDASSAVEDYEYRASLQPFPASSINSGTVVYENVQMLLPGIKANFYAENAENFDYVNLYIEGWYTEEGSSTPLGKFTLIEPIQEISPSSTPVLPLATPESFTATVSDGTSVQLSWKGVSGAEAYEIHRGDAIIAIVSQLSYLDDNLDEETFYSYKIRAVQGNRYSEFTTAIGVTTTEADLTPTPDTSITPTPDPNESQLVPIFDEYTVFTVDNENRDFDQLNNIKQGQVLGMQSRTVAGAEVAVSVTGSNYRSETTADTQGFWQVEIPTTDFEPGEYAVVLTISAEEYPVDFISDPLTFTVVAGDDEALGADQPDAEGVEDNGVSNTLQLVIYILTAVGVVAAVLGFIGWKQGWFAKWFGKKGEAAENPDINAERMSFSERNVDIDSETDAPEESFGAGDVYSENEIIADAEANGETYVTDDNKNITAENTDTQVTDTETAADFEIDKGNGVADTDADLKTERS